MAIFLIFIINFIISVCIVSGLAVAVFAIEANSLLMLAGVAVLFFIAWLCHKLLDNYSLF